MLIGNGIIFTGDQFREDWKVILRDNRISEAGSINRTEDRSINLEGDYLLP